MIRSFNCIILILLTAPVALAQPTVLQRINKIGSFAGEGIVADIQPGEIVIQGDNGRRAAFLIQNKDERFLSLDGNDYIVRMPSNIEVTGRLPGKLLERGMVVRFRGEINRSGRTGTPVKRIDVIAGDQSSLKLEPLREPEGRAFVPCDFVGIIQRFTNQSMYLVVPKTRWTPTQRIAVRVADDAYFDLQADDLNRVQDGDRVVAFRGDKMANGALVIRDIKVELTPEREVATPTFSDQLYLKYSKLSDDPADPRQENSDHFILHTDISPRMPGFCWKNWKPCTTSCRATTAPDPKHPSHATSWRTWTTFEASSPRSPFRKSEIVQGLRLRKAGRLSDEVGNMANRP